MVRKLRIYRDEGSAGGAGSGAGAGAAAGGDGGAGQGAGAGAGASDKTFTQDQVNDMTAKAEGKALAKVLKDLGIDDVKTGKEALAKWRELQDGQKTEVQRLTDQLNGFGEKEKGYTSTITELSTKIAAYELGIPADKIDHAVKLAINGGYEGETMNEKLAAVLKDYPMFAGDGATPPTPPARQRGPDFGGTVKGAQGNTAEALKARAKAAMANA